jgi:DNA-binding NtrC family response regulator
MKKPTILLVEDDDGIRGVVTMWLKKAYNVEAFDNYYDAADWLDANQKTSPDLVLTDFEYKSPTGKGGLDTAKKVHALHGHDVPCVLMTSAAKEIKDDPECQQHFAEIIEKPVSKTVILSAVSRHLRSSSGATFALQPDTLTKR